MKKLFFINVFFCLIVPCMSMAEDASDFYIMHDLKLLLKEIPEDLEWHEVNKFIERYSREGFQELSNPHDSLVACGSEDCRPGMSITFPYLTMTPPPLSSIPPPDFTIYKKFRVFVPPGTTSLNLNIVTKPGKDVKVAARMNYVPEINDTTNLSYTTQGTYELRYLDYSQVQLKSANNQIHIYNSTPYPLSSSVNPLAEDHSGWIYVTVFSGVENIESINYAFTVNSIIYNPWYNNYFKGQDAYGLNDQSIIPMVAAMAGSQLLKTFGQVLTEEAIKKLGVMFRDKTGQIVQSGLYSGDGSVIPLGCDKFGCCVGIGIMATPTGVANAFNAFQRTAICGLDQMFTSANEAFHLYWGLPITTEFSKNRQAFTKLVENQNNNFQQLFVGLAAGQAELKTQEQFGKYSVFNTIHLGKDIAQATQIQKAAEPQLTKKIYDELEAYRYQFTNPDQIIDYHNEKNEDIFQGTNLVATEGTMDTDQIKAAIQMTELLLDPYPDIKVPESKQQTRAAKITRTVKTAKKSQLVISQHIYSENITEQSPTVSNEAVNKIRASMGYTGDPLPDGSRISSKAFMELLAESKLANPNWYTEGAGKNDFGCSREALVLKAFALEQDLHRLFKLQRQTLLKAQLLAGRVNLKLYPELNQAFENAASE